MGMLQKVRIQLQSQLDEVKRNAADESRERLSLLGKYKNLEHEVDGLHFQFEEESSGKADVQRQLNKALQEADLWRQKYEIEGLAKAEELEMSKMKLQSRLTEAQGTMENLNAKLHQLDVAGGKLQTEIDDMAVQADQAHVLNNQMEKKAKQFDRVVAEWKRKVDGLGLDLDTSIKDCRNASSELFRVKSAYEESVIQLDEVR